MCTKDKDNSLVFLSFLCHFDDYEEDDRCKIWPKIRQNGKETPKMPDFVKIKKNKKNRKLFRSSEKFAARISQALVRFTVAIS